MTLAEFFSMGGYGFYVWASFGMTALLIIVEVIYLKRQRISLVARIRQLNSLNSGVKK